LGGDVEGGEKEVATVEEVVQVGYNMLKANPSVVPGVVSFGGFDILHVPI
jgi:hypothetical protein